MSFSRGALCLVLITGAVALAGCEAEVSTGGNDLNTDEAEKAIVDQYPAQAGGLTLEEVDCDTTEAEVGNTFECQATNSVGIHLDIEGTIDRIDEDTDRAHFTTEVVKAVSDGTSFANDLLAALKKRGTAVESIDCPEITVKKGVKATCDMTMTSGSKQTVTITQTDGDGTFDYDTSGPQGG